MPDNDTDPARPRTASTPLEGVIAAAITQLEDFPGARVLPTTSIPSNGKLPLLRGGCLSAVSGPGEVRELFSRSDCYGLGLAATGYASYPAPDIVITDGDEK